MWEDIRIGDRVREKKGGPIMVVEAFDDAGLTYCYWTKNGETRTGSFTRDDLEFVNRPSEDNPAELGEIKSEA